MELEFLFVPHLVPGCISTVHRIVSHSSIVVDAGHSDLFHWIFSDSFMVPRWVQLSLLRACKSFIL